MWMWLALACAPTPRDPAPVLVIAGNADVGEAQYQIRCASCHGASGGGVSRTPPLAGSISKLSDTDVVSIMLNGRGNMTRQSGMQDKHAADVLAYLRKAFP